MSKKGYKKSRRLKKILLFHCVAVLAVICLVLAWEVASMQDPMRASGSASVMREDPERSPAAEPGEAAPLETGPGEEPEPVFEEKDITLMAVGDNLMHLGIVYTGLMQDGSFDYGFLFEGISEFLDAADIKIVNQETIFGGNELGFSGFPHFNSPTEVGDAIAGAGFNVVLQASNHTADQGLAGMENCMDFWKTHPEVLVTGVHEDADEEAHEIPLLEIEGVTFAILNYTYGPNMGTLEESLRGRLDMLCNWDENTGRIDFTTIHPKVLDDIETAKRIADVVIVCPHWGTEYTPTPSRYQRTFAEQMTQAGADVIIGTHPHVVQPVEWIESENGNRALCYYSLGNYVSTQKEGLSMLEGMAWIHFRVKEDGVVILEEDSGVIPMVCHYRSGPVRLEKVYLLEDYTAEKAAAHGIHNYGEVNLQLDDLLQWNEEILGDRALTRDRALKARRAAAEDWEEEED